MMQSFSGKEVTSLQTMLRTLARVEEGLPSVIPDGIYGRDTMAAVTAFQRKRGLPQTGVVTGEDWEAITNAYRRAVIDVLPAEPLAILLAPGQVLLLGSRNRHVPLVQVLLQTVAGEYEDMPVPEITGVYDQCTADAVQWLQARNNETPSGILDKRLWRILVGLYTHNVGDGEPEPYKGSATQEEEL